MVISNVRKFIVLLFMKHVKFITTINSVMQIFFMENQSSYLCKDNSY